MKPKYLELNCNVEFDYEVLDPITSSDLLKGIDSSVQGYDLEELRYYLFKIEDKNYPVLSYETENSKKIHQFRVSAEHPILDIALDAMLEGNTLYIVDEFKSYFFSVFDIDSTLFLNPENIKAMYDSTWILGGIDKYRKKNQLSFNETLKNMSLIEKKLVETRFFGDNININIFDEAKKNILPEFANAVFMGGTRGLEYYVNTRGEVCRDTGHDINYLN
jgi:hypothetical protein